MTRLSIPALVLALAGAACDDSPVSPSNTAPTFTATLLPTNEVPPVTTADASASGNVSVTVLATRDANGAVTGGTVDFNVVMTGFPPNTTLTGSHIHNGRAGTNAPVVIDTGIRSGDIVLANGAGSFTRTMTLTTPAHLLNATNLLNDPAGFYFNVHTTTTPPGAIRGQLVRIQ